MYLATTLLPAKCSSQREHCRDGRLHLLNIFVRFLVHFHNNNLHPSLSFHVEGLQTITQTDPLLKCCHLWGKRQQLSVVGRDSRGLGSSRADEWDAGGIQCLGCVRCHVSEPFFFFFFLPLTCQHHVLLVEKPAKGVSGQQILGCCLGFTAGK